MPLYTILHRWSATPIALVEAADFPRALALAVEQRVKLLYADLEGTVAPWTALAGADLRGADLSHAELACADLQGADLRTAVAVGTYFRRALLGRADLRQADLRRADLRLASLEEARLVGADLRGTLLLGARLRGAVLDWRYSTIALELLRQDRGASRHGSKLLAELAFEDDARPFAWLKTLVRHRAAADWSLSILARHHPRGRQCPGPAPETGGRRRAAALRGRADPHALDPPARRDAQAGGPGLNAGGCDGPGRHGHHRFERTGDTVP